jgi:dipeptidyl aminopeptidase/acylaminoacyl peptidase
VKTSDITYDASGTTVPARLYEDGGSRAGVLLCPGRLRSIDGLEFLSLALAEAGYVVLATTYRGMDFFTDDDDVVAGLDHLGRIGELELAVVGHSRGGMAALRSAAKDDRIASVVALQPPTEFSSYVRAMELLSPQRHAAIVASMGGTEEQQPERYRDISAVNYADRIGVPVLLVGGTQDQHAPVDHQQWMYDALVAAGNTRCRLEILDQVGHFFERMYFGYEFDRVARLTVDWLNETLNGR